MDEESIIFIKNLEEQLGSKISYRTLSTWYYSFSDKTLRTYGVFICLFEDKLYLEDFNRVPTILGYPVKNNSASKYVKYSRTINLADIEYVQLVKKSQVESVINSNIYTPLNKISKTAKLFSRFVTEVKLKGEDSIYFELINPKAFSIAIGK